MKIQFTDKIDSIFVILVKFRSYIDIPIHLYCFNLPAIAVTSSSTTHNKDYIRTFRRIPTNSYNRNDSILLVAQFLANFASLFIDIIRRSLYERFAILALCAENLVVYQTTTSENRVKSDQFVQKNLFLHQKSRYGPPAT